MRRPLTILFSSAGRRVALIDCFRRAAQSLGIPVRILASDCAPGLSAACQVADAFFHVPRCTDPTFIPATVDLCRTENVTLLIPTIDPELVPLATARDHFHACRTRLAISEPEVITFARNKLLTHQFLIQNGIPSPRTAPAASLLASTSGWNFPIILKPTNGSSSRDIHRIDSLAALNALARTGPTHIAQEFCDGPEYTVNLFFDRDQLRCAVPHRRIETRDGEVSKARTERVPALDPIIRSFDAALSGKAFGALCFQAVVGSNEQAVVLELNARFGGGYPLADEAGGTFAKWLIEDALGLPSSAHDKWRENLLMLRHEQAVFRIDRSNL